MFDSFKKIKRAFHIPSDREREEAYLNSARDRYDLEYRMRQVDAGKFRSGF